MKVEKATLDFGSAPQQQQQQLDENALYLIDFTKITSVNDLVLILASVGFSFSPRHPHFNNIRPFLALDNPIPMNQPVVPKQEEIKLPKLKKIK